MNNQTYKLILGYDIAIFTNFPPYCHIDGNSITEASYDILEFRGILDSIYGKEFIINKIKEQVNYNDLKDSRTVYIELDYPSEEEIFYHSLMNDKFGNIIECYKVNGN